MNSSSVYYKIGTKGKGRDKTDTLHNFDMYKSIHIFGSDIKKGQDKHNAYQMITED